MLEVKEMILIAIIVLQSLLHFCERRDLYNRLMSKDFTEYNQNHKPPPKQVPSAHDRILKRWRNKAGDD